MPQFATNILMIISVVIVVAVAFVIGWFIDCMVHVRRIRNQRIEDYALQKLRDILLEHELTEEWGNIVEGASGRTDEFMDRMADFLSGGSLPHTSVAKRNLSLGNARVRPFLVARNSRVKGLRILIGAEKFGDHLSISWYYAADPEELKLIGLAEQREKKRALYDESVLQGRRSVKSREESAYPWLDDPDGWVEPLCMNVLDRKEMENWKFLILARVKQEAGRLRQTVEKEKKTLQSDGGFIDLS